MAAFINRVKAVPEKTLKKWIIDNASDYLLSDDEAKAYAHARWMKFFPGEPFPIMEPRPLDPPAAPDAGPDGPTPAFPGAPLLDAIPENEAKAEPEGVVDLMADAEDEAGVAGGEPAQSETEEQDGEGRPGSVSNLTPEQARIKALVDQAPTEAPQPTIDNVVDLKHIEQAAIPTFIRESRKENSYRWVDVTNLEDSLDAYGGIWVIVTQSNHGHLPRNFFGMDGAISYKASVILCFTNRTLTDAIEKRTIDALSMRIDKDIDNLERKFMDAAGNEVATVERVKGSGDGGYGTSELTQDADYDYGPTPDHQ